MAKAFHFIEVGKDQCLSLTPEGEFTLMGCSGPIYAINVWGSGRVGKTTTVKELVRRSPAAGIQTDLDILRVGDTSEAVTAGVDAVLVPLENDGGNLLLCDFEGFKNPKARGPRNLQVLGIMTASVLVQMESGRPDEKHLHDLVEACTEARKRFAQDPSARFDVAPALVYTIAGVPNNMTYPKNYMEDILAYSGSNSLKELRSHFRHCFSDTAFCALPVPPSGPMSHSLDRLWKSGYHGALDVMWQQCWEFTSARPLQVSGVKLSGRDFLNFMGIAIKCLNADKPVDVTPAWRAIVLKEYEGPIKHAADTFSEQTLPYLRELIQDPTELERVKAGIIKVFDSTHLLAVFEARKQLLERIAIHEQSINNVQEVLAKAAKDGKKVVDVTSETNLKFKTSEKIRLDTGQERHHVFGFNFGEEKRAEQIVEHYDILERRKVTYADGRVDLTDWGVIGTHLETVGPNGNVVSEAGVATTAAGLPPSCDAHVG